MIRKVLACLEMMHIEQAVDGRPPRYAPAPLLPLWAPKRRRADRRACRRQRSLVTLTFDLESGIRVTCDVGYLCANLDLPLCSRLRPDGCTRQTDIIRHRQTNRQTDRRQTASSLNAPAY